MTDTTDRTDYAETVAVEEGAQTDAARDPYGRGVCGKCGVRAVYMSPMSGQNIGYCGACGVKAAIACTLRDHGCPAVLHSLAAGVERSYLPLDGSPPHDNGIHAEHRCRESFHKLGIEDLSRWLFDLCAAGEDSAEYPVLVSARKVQDKLMEALDSALAAARENGVF